MRCLRKLAVGLGDFRSCPNGTLVPNPRQEKKTSPSFDSCFLESYAIRKAPPAISLRLFQRDHFGRLPAGCLSAGLPTGKSKRGTLSFITHFISSLLLYFCQFDFIYSFKNKVLRSVRISNQIAGALSDKQ